RLDKLPVRPEWMLNQYGALFGSFVADGVDLSLQQPAGGGHDPSANLDGSEFVRAALLERLDFHFQIQRVGNEPFLLRLQIFDPRVAGIDSAVEDRDWTLHQVQGRGVLKPQAVQRELA